MKSKKRMIANLLLILTAFIWGCAFVAQSVGMDYVGPFTFNGVRSLIGCVVLLPVIFVLDKQRVRRGEPSRQKPTKALLVGGLLCGLALCSASTVQQVGISMPGITTGKAGFVTALYIVLVPVLGIFLKKKAPAFVWLGVLLATAGLYLLCMNGGFSVSAGDVYLLLSALLFSIHILLVDHYSPLVDGVRLSCIQFLVTGILCMVLAFAFEHPSLTMILAAWKPIGYAGVLSCGVAYTLQIVAQKDTDPTVASLLMSLESTFSVLAGWMLLGQTLTPREGWGCVLVFIAIVLAQLPADFFKRLFRKEAKSEHT